MTPEEEVKDLKRQILVMEAQALLRYAEYDEQLAKLRRFAAAKKLQEAGVENDQPNA